MIKLLLEIAVLRTNYIGHGSELGHQSGVLPQAQNPRPDFFPPARSKLKQPHHENQNNLTNSPTSSKESVTMGFLDILTDAGLTGKLVLSD